MTEQPTGSCDHGGGQPAQPNPLGPHVQVINGWLDDNGCLLPDEDGIAYKRTFTDWEECESKCRYCPSVLADEQEFRHGICGGCADDGMAEMRNG